MLKKLLLVTLLSIAWINPVAAYVGPGAGISLIGSLIGVVTAVFVALGALLVWPIRRMIKRKKEKQSQESQESQESQD